ncbi:MAG: TIGR00282 family metallophosphoesterase [Termitinemataceae bacterium]|nr:MAG: TIGR00282 family metallophosphoesterase [Termitinemataceae bacterium]
MTKNILMIGDIVGSAGVAALRKQLPELKKKYDASFVVANGENVADGFGITESDAKVLFACGVDVITTGNHVWERREFWDYLEKEQFVLRPANYPKITGIACEQKELQHDDIQTISKIPGHGFISLKKDDVMYTVINVQGRQSLYIIDCPFKCFDAIYDNLSDDQNSGIILVDFHAEVCEEKESFSFYLDGRATVVAGTHTHVQTADEKIMPRGTAYITDLGMTGVHDSVIGMKKEICIERSKTNVLYKMECAEGDGCVDGICVTVDTEYGKAIEIKRL